MSVLKTAGLLAMAVLALYGMQRTSPGYADITRPIAVRGKLGENVQARTFALQTTGVRLARRLRYEAYGQEHVLTTSGVWAVVGVRAEALAESLSIMSAGWRAQNGARYEASQRLSTFSRLISQQRLEPGLPRDGLIVFEVPESQLAGATILVSQASFLPLDSELEIDPGGLGASQVTEEIRLEPRDG